MDIYNIIIKPFLAWVQANQIQTFVDVIGDMGFVLLIPIMLTCAFLVIACCIKYLAKK